jgi:hypothetical protein
LRLFFSSKWFDFEEFLAYKQKVPLPWGPYPIYNRIKGDIFIWGVDRAEEKAPILISWGI